MNNARLSYPYLKSAAWLALLDKHWSAKWEAVSSNPDGTNTQDLKITEQKVLPL